MEDNTRLGEAIDEIAKWGEDPDLDLYTLTRVLELLRKKRWKEFDDEEK